MNLVIPVFSEFKNFILAIFRKWIFLVFVLITIIAVIVQWVLPEFSPPLSLYFGFLFVGFVWSAFQVYKDLLVTHRKMLVTPVEKAPTSELFLSFVAGKEYKYSVSDPYSGQNLYITRMQKTPGTRCRFDGRGVLYINDRVYYVMSKGSLEINIRVENSGDLPLDILDIRSDNDLDLRYLHMISDDVFHNGNKLRLPLHLKKGQFVVLQLRTRIAPGKGASNAEFTVDFQSLPKSVVHEIYVGTKDIKDRTETYPLKIEIPSKPLVDLFVKQWREYEQEEYIVLSGHSL